MLTVPSDPTNARAHPVGHWTGLAYAKNNRLASSSVRYQLTVFFKITNNPNPPLPGMTSFTSQSHFAIWGFYYDICNCHILRARV